MTTSVNEASGPLATLQRHYGGDQLGHFLVRIVYTLVLVGLLGVVLAGVSALGWLPEVPPYITADPYSGSVNVPYLEAQEEAVMHFTARDAAASVLESFPDQFGQFVLFLDEFTRPGHNLLYGIPSWLGFAERRGLSLFLLLLTTAELMRIVFSLTFDQRRIENDKRDSLRNRSRGFWSAVTVAVAVVFFWWQPWVAYFGYMSLPSTPVMYLLTAAVAAVLQRRFTRASLLLGFLPLFHHEALLLLPLWFLYLYRMELLHFFSHQFVEIFRAPFDEDGQGGQNITWLEDVVEAIGKKDNEDREERKLRAPLWYATLSLLPYLTWNFITLGYSNQLPMARVVTFFGNLVAPIFGREPYLENLYRTQRWDLLLDHAGYWVGAVVAAFFVGALLISGIFFLAQFLWWQEQQPDARRRELAYLLVEHSLTSRYTWWYFFAGYFLVETALLLVPNNPFETNASAYYLLPIAPAVAIFAALPFFWIFENIHDEPIRHAQPADPLPPAEARRPPYVRVAGFIVYVLPLAILFLTGALASLPTPADLFPEGFIIEGENDDSPDERIGSYELDRQAAHEHGERAAALTHDLALATPLLTEPTGDNWTTTEAEAQLLRQRAAQPIITTDPVLRLAMEEYGLDDARRDELLDRLCPRALWAQDPTVPFYFNLFPSGSTLVISSAALSTALEETIAPDPVRRAFRADAADNGGFGINFGGRSEFRLQPWHLYYGGSAEDRALVFADEVTPNRLVLPSIAVNDTSGNDMQWRSAGRYGTFDPLQRGPEPNPGFLVYRFGEPLQDFTEAELPPERELYLRRYCGYAPQQSYAIVDAAPAPVYQTLELDAPENEPLIIHGGSRLPVLHCVREDNARREQPFYCLVVFPDRRPDVLDALWDRQRDIASDPGMCFDYQGRPEEYVNPPLRADSPQPPLSPGCIGWVEIRRNVYLEGPLPEVLEPLEPGATPERERR